MFKIDDLFNEVFIVSESIQNDFIKTFKDENPLHVDNNFAREKGFLSKVMHGNILNGFISYFIGECLPIKNVIIHSQNIEFKNPVYLNDTLYFESIVIGVFDSVKVTEMKYKFVNEEKKIVAKGKIQIGIL